MKRKKIIPEGRYLINVEYLPSVRNPSAYWDSSIKNKVVEVDEQSLERFLTELLQEDGGFNKRIKVQGLVYDDNDSPVGVWCNVYTEDYYTGKKLYFEAWITIRKVCDVEFLKELE